MIKKVAIFGTSGFASEVADICFDLGVEDILLLAAEGDVDIRSVNGLKVVSESYIHTLVREGYVFALGIGEPSIKERIYNAFPELEFPNLIHRSVTVGMGQRELLNKSKGNILAAGVRLTNRVVIGDFNTFNLNVTVGHECYIASYTTISPGVNVSGNVRLNNNVYIGTNASILQGTADNFIDIGEGSVVGAGSFVRQNVASGDKVAGVPAKSLRHNNSE